MKIEKLTVERGRSQEIAPNVWDKTTYTMQASLESESELELTKAKLEAIMDDWLMNAPPPLTPKPKKIDPLKRDVPKPAESYNHLKLLR